MAILTETELNYRKILAQRLLDLGRTSLDDQTYVDFQLLSISEKLTLDLQIPFPEGLEPLPMPINPKPAPDNPLPQVDIVVVTWTVAENDALSDVMTPGFNRNAWYRYDRFFNSKYAPQIRNGAPASKVRRLGSYFLTNISNKKVLCFKSELHLNQDGIQNFNGTDQTSLPVRDLFKQIIQETNCKLILTLGTCGGIMKNHDLGDVLVTTGARFKCQREFKNAPFNNKTFDSKWQINTSRFGEAENLMERFANNLSEPVFGPPTVRHQGENWMLPAPYQPAILHDRGKGRKKIPKAHPILTTDFFEFGHSGNAAQLWAEGCGVEMGDAVLGLVCSQDIHNPPKWAVIRNLSDPQINGGITNQPSALNMQIHWAVWYYETYGYWTSIMSSIATWAVIVEN